MLASPFSCIVWEGAACVIAQNVVSNDVHVRFLLLIKWAKYKEDDNKWELEEGLPFCDDQRVQG